ncbi:MAG: TldD/PmbA family protein [Candidatus Micrarchaeia archaeon]
MSNLDNKLDSFGDKKNIAEYALKQAEKISQYAEVYVENSIGYGYAIEQGKINGGAFSDRSGMRIRIIKEGRLYTLSTNILKKDKIDELLSNVKKFKSKQNGLSEEKAAKDNIVIKEKIDVNEENFLNTLYSYEKILKTRAYVPYRSIYGNYERDNTYYINTDGSEISSSIPYVSVFASFIVHAEDRIRERMLQLGGVGGLEALDGADKRIAKEARTMKHILERGVSLPDYELSKIKNVVISPEIAGIAAHESVGHPNEADRVFGREAAQAGRSYITKDNLGMKIGSDAVTIVDDPTIEHSYGFYLYDDEGIKARPKELIKNGMQNELLLNREYAYELNTKSNGSARSDNYTNEPIIRMSNTYLKPSNEDINVSELIWEARNGIYIKSFTEWNIDDTRSFSLYQGNEAYLIDRGGITMPVLNFKLETSTLEFWNAVDVVANDFELFLGTCGKGEPEQGVPVTMGGASALLRFKK